MPMKSLFLIFCFVFSASGIFAVSPDINLPEWQKTEFGIADWSPENGILVVRATIRAINTDLHQVSCSLSQQLDAAGQKEAKGRERLKAGESAVFLFRLSVKGPAHGWLDFDLQARPDADGLLQQIAKISGKPLTAEILRDEVAHLNQPIKIGQSIPIVVSNDIALNLTPEMTFSLTSTPAGGLYLWLPKERFSTGIVAESLKAMNKAVETGQFKSAAAACTLVINRLNASKENLKAETRPGETIEIPGKTMIEMLKVNRATFSDLDKKDAGELKSLIDSLKPSYSKAFAHFNLSRILVKKDNRQAQLQIEQALKIIPTWPEAASLKKHLK
ncbi:MAG: hypothetical protein ACOYXC_17380 [Candidatus Rifleibacteriota bacterium]